MLDVISLFFGNPVDVPGHIGFLLIALSLFLTDIFWLRVTLIAAFSFQIAYFALAPAPLYTGIAYDVIFILINLYRLRSLRKARRLVDATEGGAALRAGFSPLDDERLAHLVEFGEAVEFDDGALIVTKGEPVDAVYLLLAGAAQVEIGGTPVGSLGPGDFIGEVSFLTGIGSIATIRSAGPLRAVALDAERLRAAAAEDPALSAAIHHLIGDALAEKLRRADGLIAAGAAKGRRG